MSSAQQSAVGPADGTKTAPESTAGVSSGWFIAAAVAGSLVLAAALLLTGTAATRALADPGALTRWALPLAKAVHNVSMAAVIGALVFAVVIVPQYAGVRRRSRDRAEDGPAARVEHPAFSRVLNLAAGAALVWALSAVAVLVFTFSDVAGQPLRGGADYTSAMADYILNISIGRAWLWMAVIAAVTATLCFAVRTLFALACTTVLALAGIIPVALIGHSATGDDHTGAINSIALHLLGVSLWVGGLIALAAVSRRLAAPRGDDGGGSETAAVLQRYSSLAGFAFFLVFASGVLNALVRMNSLDQLASPYGRLVVLKALATLLLGVIGFLHRRWLIPGLGRRHRAARVLWQLVVGELLVMAAVMGLAVALGRTAPPVPEELPPDATPARILTGYPLPPELEGSRWLTEWRFDWLWVAFVVTTGAAYLLGMVKVHRRGDSWPLLRGICWLVGLAALTYVTSGPPAVYGMVLFSAHMFGHMALTMVIPLFLVLGAPVTLALKALTPRGDGTRGIREWILVLVHSPFARFVTHPVFVAVNFAGSIVFFYYSEAFGYALREHPGHELMIVHFLLTGFLFVMSMIGIDPLPRRATYPMRLVILLATMAFHAFFGVSVMGSTSLIQASWFGNLGRDWGVSALEDQQLGGAVMWGIGEVPTVLVAIGVALQWSKSDARESKRMDRAADRNNDADLAAYNDMFARLAARDARIPAGPGAGRTPSGGRTAAGSTGGGRMNTGTDSGNNNDSTSNGSMTPGGSGTAGNQGEH